MKNFTRRNYCLIEKYAVLDDLLCVENRPGPSRPDQTPENEIRNDENDEFKEKIN